MKIAADQVWSAISVQIGDGYFIALRLAGIEIAHRLEGAVSFAEEHAELRGMIVRGHDIGNPVSIQIGDGKAGIGPAQFVCHLRLEGAIAVPEENADVLIGVIGDDDVLLAVQVQICGSYELDLVSSAVGLCAWNVPSPLPSRTLTVLSLSFTATIS